MLIVVKEVIKEREVLNKEDKVVVIREEEALKRTLREVLALLVEVKRVGSNTKVVVEVYKSKEN